MKTLFWWFWIVLTVFITAYYGYKILYADDKTQLLIGETTYGHYQIEISCGTCHTEAFGGGEVIQNACVQCHGAELETVNDSHPKKKFTDPRNADLLEVVDARYCVSCHTEHHKEKTHAMGLTIPEDYCFHCHKDVIEERKSHKELAFDTCATAGCHNYHDNRALYEGFLVKHGNDPAFNVLAELPERTAAKEYKAKNPEVLPLDQSNIAESIATLDVADDVIHQWESSAHAENGVTCNSCHIDTAVSAEWIVKPTHQQCASCHENQVAGFLESKHGMRLADTNKLPLKAITPAESSALAFKDSSLQIEHGCAACHEPHGVDTQKAAVESCLTCHNDEHSLAFLDSPHGQLWQQTLTGELPKNQGVSCASCHMPRQHFTRKKERVFVEHNQNITLRPNEKMIRPVCMNCHGLGFAIDALADENLINNNFNGQAVEHIPSIDWALERENR